MSVPLLSHDEAVAVGALLRARQSRAGGVPVFHDELGWADIVQFVLFNARELAVARNTRPGWVSWGNQTDKFAQEAA